MLTQARRATAKRVHIYINIYVNMHIFTPLHSQSIKCCNDENIFLFYGIQMLKTVTVRISEFMISRVKNYLMLRREEGVVNEQRVIRSKSTTQACRGQ